MIKKVNKKVATLLPPGQYKVTVTPGTPFPSTATISDGEHAGITIKLPTPKFEPPTVFDEHDLVRPGALAHARNQLIERVKRYPDAHDRPQDIVLLRLLELLEELLEGPNSDR